MAAGQAAAKTGIQPGDVITALNNTQTPSEEALAAKVALIRQDAKKP